MLISGDAIVLDIPQISLGDSDGILWFYEVVVIYFILALSFPIDSDHLRSNQITFQNSP